jgi:hypothetical protein
MSTLQVQQVSGVLNFTTNTSITGNNITASNLTLSANVNSNNVNANNISANTINISNSNLIRINSTGSAFFPGNSTAIAAIMNNIAETTNVYSVGSNSTINYDLTAQSVLFSTVNATANFTVNLRGNANSTLDSIMNNGQTVTIAYLASNGPTAFFSNTFSIDGFIRSVRWQNSIIPTAGNANSIDSYAFTVIKTTANTYTVFGTQTQFK